MNLASSLQNQDGLISQKMQELFGTATAAHAAEHDLHAFANVNIARTVQSQVQVEECETTPIVV